VTIKPKHWFGVFAASAALTLFIVVAATRAEPQPTADAHPRVPNVDAESAQPATRNERVATEVAPRDGPTLPAVDATPLHGMVVDCRGQPLAGVHVVFCDLDRSPVAGVPIAVSGLDGTFALPAGRVGNGSLHLDDANYVAVLEPFLYEEVDARLELTIVAAPRRRLRGMVVDTAGLPVADASLFLTFNVDVRPRIPRVLDRNQPMDTHTKSARDGAFLFVAAPDLAGVELHGRAPGCKSASTKVAPGVVEVRFVLERLPMEVLDGTVVDAADRPAAGAAVTLASVTTTSDAQGRFKIDLSLTDGSSVLVAAQPGQLSAVMQVRGDWRTRSAWPQPLVLRLGGPALAIRGRLLHADGSPVADPRVELIGAASHRCTELPGVPRADGSRGEFEIRGLTAGDYRVCAVDPASLDAICSPPIRAGGDTVDLRLTDEAGLWPPLRGVVVDRRGNPLAGADWMVERDAPTGDGAEPIQGEWLHADANGRLRLGPLSRRVHSLLVKAAGMAEFERFPLQQLGLTEEFRVVVSAGCQARVEFADRTTTVDSVGLVDSQGREAPVVMTQGNHAWGTRKIEIRDGCSQTFIAPEDCIELVLWDGAQVVSRMPVQLRPGTLNVLRP
jgi:hypothetical protein